MENKTNIVKDASGKKLVITREFNAPKDLVWKAWTEQELLDQWWAPEPWKTETRTMDFREGGHWLYAMKGPEGEEHWCRADYISIDPGNSYTGKDAFCDSEGKPLPDAPPGMHWNCRFSASGSGTLVHVEVSFDSEADLEKIVEMGFKEGFTMAHGNLDKLLVRG
jgi:uncharacterized protein YndB with AHSA1/START domain